MRFRLVGIALGLLSAEQPIDQDARARSGIAVDHQAGIVRERGLHRLFGGLSFEALVARAKEKALHALPAFHERKAGREQMLVVNAGSRIDEMHRREIAFAALRGADAALAADRDGARGKAALGERPDHDIERHVVAAGQNEIGRAR